MIPVTIPPHRQSLHQPQPQHQPRPQRQPQRLPPPEIPLPPPQPLPQGLSQRDIHELEGAMTKMYPSNQEAFYTYNRVKWSLNLRKEVSKCAPPPQPEPSARDATTPTTEGHT